MRYAVIGTSWITQAFIDAANTVERCELSAVYSRNGEKARAFAEKNGISLTYTDLDALSRSNEFDAVYVASPNSLHYQQSKIMLKHGKHVICEKPAAVTPDEILELTALAKSKRLVYMEAIMFLHMPELNLLKAAIGKIGKVSSASLDFSQLSSKYKLLLDGKNPNIFNPELCTGCLMDIGVYNIYAALELFGKPQAVMSAAQFISTGADSCGAAVLTYPDILVTLTYSKTGQSSAASQIFGDKGTVLLDSVSQLQNIRIKYTDNTEEFICGEQERTPVMANEARAFRDFIENYDELSERLEYAQKLSVEVSAVMQIIRRQNQGFKF